MRLVAWVRLPKPCVTACESVGVEITTDAPVDKVIVDNGAATGVTLSNGETITAKRVISNVNPKMLYGQMFDEGDLDPEFSPPYGWL